MIQARGQIANERVGNNTHLFICAVVEVEGARRYDIYAAGLLTDVVYNIGRMIE